MQTETIYPISPNDLRTQLSSIFGTIACEVMDISFEGRVIKNGVGFFPYGSGLIGSEKTLLPQNGIMIVGQDFGTIDYLTDKILAEGEATNRTYNNLTSIIPLASLNQYFFTNLLIGLRTSEPMSGRNLVLGSQKKKYANYLQACFTFFEEQVKSTNPRLIIALGKVPFQELLKQYAQNDFIDFRTYNSGKKDHAINVFGKTYPIIAIPHPSMWHFNLSREERENIGKILT